MRFLFYLIVACFSVYSTPDPYFSTPDPYFLFLAFLTLIFLFYFYFFDPYFAYFILTNAILFFLL